MVSYFARCCDRIHEGGFDHGEQRPMVFGGAVASLSYFFLTAKKKESASLEGDTFPASVTK